MGRKPNALILHYFHRGPKLEDASNRYQHTCKACGEDFPKGRIDSLQNHLTKKCPALSVSERTHVVLQIHNVQLGATAAAKKENAKAAKENKAPNAPPQNRTPQQTFDGLNVLAEASRQVGQVERRGSQAYPQVSGPHEDPMNMAIDPALDVFPHSFPNTFDHELGSFSQTHVPTSNAMSTIPPLPHLPTENAEDDQPHAHNMPSPPPENGDVSMTNQPDNELSTIAADANELLPANPPQGSAPVTTSSEAPQSMDPDISDKHTSAEVENVDRNQVNRNLGNETAHADNPVQEPVSHAAADIDTSTSIATQRTGTIQGSSSSIEQMATDGGDGLSKSGEPWINFDGPHFQAFYEEMQRASQASETPLMTSAPQQRPIAARSDFKAGEFGTFTLDTHPPAKATRQKFSANRRKEVQDVRKVGACLRCRMLRKPCSLESPCATCRNVESARLWKEPCMRVRITELFDLYAAGLHASLAYRDISLVKGQLQFEQVHGQVVAAHSNESDNAVNVKALQGRIDSTAVGVPLIGAVNVSLAAQEVKLLDADGEDVLTKVSHYLQSNGGKLYESEPSHIIRSTLLTLAEMNEENKDPLFDDVLQLWTTTHVLCDLELQWKISFISAITQDQSVIDEGSDALSYSLITSQLRSFAEKRAAQLCKKVLQNFEKRLMHNKREFDIFLLAIVLLNCVERTSWLFRVWQDEVYANRWPLERQPQAYWYQGEHFSDIFHMVLRMRVVPPKTSPRPDNGVLMPIDPVSDSVTAWFDSVQVTVDYLNERQAAGFDPTDSRSWDLKFAAKILLPQACHT